MENKDYAFLAKLFVKYMAYVDDIEGTDFVKNGFHMTEVGFSNDELDILRDFSYQRQIIDINAPNPKP